MGAYYVNYLKNDAGVDTLSAVVYANASSPASFPAYGNMLLQAIGQTATGNPNFSLKFEYKPFT